LRADVAHDARARQQLGEQTGTLEARGDTARGAHLAVAGLRVRVEVAWELDDLVGVRREQRVQVVVAHGNSRLSSAPASRACGSRWSIVNRLTPTTTRSPSSISCAIR